jgi:hypothetical protein
MLKIAKRSAKVRKKINKTMEQLQLFNIRKRYSFLSVGVFCVVSKDFPSQSYLVVMGTEANEEKWL